MSQSFELRCELQVARNSEETEGVVNVSNEETNSVYEVSDNTG